MLLRATELNLIAHPIAGYKPQAVAEILNVPREMTVIALVAVGAHSAEISQRLSESQVRDERERPERLQIGRFFFENRYN